MVMKIDITTRLDELLKIVCDPKNQPHQFMGDGKGIRDVFFLGKCNCTEPPILDKSDVKIIICGECKNCVDD